ncbi:aldehyde dehydrogenase [Pseudomonas sp. B21-056]|jgi:gamma-glutamyl-gamma-aminobutyraldehyde dehydrogenase|uniref:aldehyde dehydrogenase n=1 Tax=Pseudomonas sp. B21-056 TaxID=2895495 RepID=UPI0022303404|nr:aldehyde dehydrogenase [Pseudomonas sp. B21-056]UZE25924.1 aldehyde dehydrogenase [Pseudomonas sp. B21-056]
MNRSIEYWQAKSESLNPEGRAFIDGKYVDSISGRTFPCINPATGKVIGTIAECDRADVDLAVSIAKQRFESGVWAKRSPTERKNVLLKLAALIQENMEQLSILESLDMGKPVEVSYAYEMPELASYVQWIAEAVDKLYDEVAPTGLGDLALIRREALGVVACVVPWNFPLDMAIWKCVPALAMGNSVVLKPAEQSSLTAIKLAELVKAAGVPDGVFNVVTGFGETVGASLGLHMDVACLAFTGSTEVGKYFLKYSAESNMKLVWLECGGKSPNIVFADTENLDQAAELAARVFYNQGEVCSSPTRLLVEDSIHDEFVARVIKYAQSYEPTDPLNPNALMGAMVEDAHTHRVMQYVEAGKAEATLAYGGEQVVINGSSNFIRPTIFTGVSNEMRVAKEEIFGPVLSIIKFNTEAEAIEIANDSIYGLMASVFTSNLSRAHRVAEALKAGTVTVNTVDMISPLVPFGGVKQSGNGRDNSLHAFEKYSSLKTTWIKY